MKLEATGLAPWSVAGVIAAMAQTANKIVRIVFEIPLGSMLTIMNNSTNDFEVVNGVIQSVAVYVMNMFRRQEISSQKQLYNESVQEHGTGSSRNRNSSISSSVVDPVFSIVDNNIVFHFNLSIVGDTDIHNINMPSSNEIIHVNFGDVWTHTFLVMDAAKKIADREQLQGDDRAILMLASMLHDVAKPSTTKQRDKKGVMRWTAYGHEPAGGPMAAEFMYDIGIKKDISNAVKALIEDHLVHVSMGDHLSKRNINSLARRLNAHGTNIERLMHLIEADLSGRPPLPGGLNEQARQFREKARELQINEQPLIPLLQGRDIMRERPDIKPGPTFGRLLNKIYELQSAGELNTSEDAVNWLKDNADEFLASGETTEN